LLLKGVKIELEQKKCGEISGLGTGPTVWDCALILGKYLEKKYPPGMLFVRDLSRVLMSSTSIGSEAADAWKGKRVLELGSGTGVVGIICALLFKVGGISWVSRSWRSG